MSRLIIISNRLPVTINKKEGELFYYPSAGGLATGLNSLDKDMNKVWIGWPGKAIRSIDEQEEIRHELAKDGLIPVFLSKKEISLHYEGFSNKTVWPHFHYFTQYTQYNNTSWEAYQAVNRKFADVIIEQIQEGDLVWVHDYQLMLVPAMIREVFPDISIGFFLHIPFPSYEIFRILPWRQEILNGLLGADQIGFHTYGYMRHFLSAVYRIVGHEHNFGKLTVSNRVVNVDVFPMGIDYNKYAHPNSDGAKDSSLAVQQLAQNRKLIISIDRLDYTKGIPQRIDAYEKFIVDNPQFRGKVTLVLIVVPSRSNVDQYQDLKHDIDTRVGNINGSYGTFDWNPIQYFFRSFSFSDLCALYQAADVAMITPLRDGMNLVAKEYIASKEESKKGVLILSEMAGAANELTDAIIVNPQDINDMTKAIVQALEMSPEDQKDRLIKMQDRLKKYTVKHWAESFMKEQVELSQFKQERKTNILNKENTLQLIQDYQSAKKRLIILDYDGTLMGFQNDPTAVVPDEKLITTLTSLHKTDENKLVVISGRDRMTLHEWLSPIGFDMAAEHGVWFKDNDKWTVSEGLNNEWKANIRPVLESLVERTPGSFIEEKDYSIAWHYRKIDKDLGEKRIREFRDVLLYLTANLDLQVLEGNKVVEIKNAGVNKGKAALHWLNKDDYDFILAIGDDHTDEDIFKALPDSAYTIKVGLEQSAAKYNLISVEHVRELLYQLVDIDV